MNPDQLYQNYQSAKQDYASSASALQGEGGYSAQLRQGIMKSLRDNEDLVRQMKAGEEGYYNAPSAARNEYQGIFNPFQRESLVDQEVGMARQGWTVPQELLKQRGGMVENIVGNMTQGYQQEIGLKQNLAEMAWREYQDAVSQSQARAGAGEVDEEVTENQLVGYLGSLVRYGENGEVEFVELDANGQEIGRKTREEAAYDLQAQTGWNRERTLNLLYKNFPEKNQPQSQVPENSQNLINMINRSILGN